MGYTKDSGHSGRNRVTTVIAALAVMVCFLFPSRAYGGELTLPASDSGGNWELAVDGKLTINSGDAYEDSALLDYKEQITSVTIGDWVSYIPSDFLNQFPNLTSVETLSVTDKYGTYGVSEIYSSAFSGCSALETVTFSEALQRIGDYAFSGCTALKTVTLGENLQTIGKYAFKGCTSLTGIAIPDSVTSVGEQAFSGCSGLTTAKLSSGMGTVSKQMFEDCSSLRSVDIPEGVSAIGNNAFSGCGSLPGVTMPESLTSIGNGAFSGCSSLLGVTIPGNVTSIGDQAFYPCKSLAEVNVLAETPPTIGGNVFYMAAFVENNKKQIYVPRGTVETYKTVWAEWKNYIYDRESGKEGLDPTAADYADTDIEVQGFTEDATVYSVDVEWGAMTFRYENSTWDATAHKVKKGAGWQVYDSVADKALAAKEAAINEIKVTNHSNAKVYAALTYASDGTTGAFTGGDGLIAASGSVPAYLSLATADNSGDSSVAGAATVAKAYFMPSGIKETDGTADELAKWTQIGTITVGIKTAPPTAP